MKERLGNYISEYSVRNKDDQNIPVYSVTNANGFCTEYFGKEVASKDKKTYKLVPRNYFAYNPSRINVGSIDCQTKEDIVIVSPLYVVFSADDRIDNRYLYYYLKSDVANYYIREKATGSVRDNLKFSMLAEFPIKIRPLDEQHNLAKRLDLLKKLIDNYQTEISLLDQLIKSRFVELFGDPLANPKKWELIPLLKMGNCKNGMNFHNDDFGIELHCLGVGDFKDYTSIEDTSKLSVVGLKAMPSADYFLENDDIVFVRSNGNKKMVGRSILVYPHDTPTIFSGFCIRFRKSDDRVNILYLLHVLKADSIRQLMYGRGANIQNLNQQTLASIKIPVPPLKLQKKFVNELTQINKSKAVIQKSLDEAQLLFDSLMQEYFG